MVISRRIIHRFKRCVVKKKKNISRVPHLPHFYSTYIINHIFTESYLSLEKHKSKKNAENKKKKALANEIYYVVHEK
jgi:hypothetical protein